ncbi:MAG: abhydrolase domain-containing protein 6 [Kangiellaceae bacterium]|jgi:abhydrolase domain-containing protein 6
MYILLLSAFFISWCLFYSKQYGIGKFLYETINSIGKRAAKLQHVRLNNEPEVYSYLTNHQPTKPTMLLLHGFSADKTIWLKYAKLASKDYHLIIPDLLGHGDIPYCEQQNYSSVEQANYIRRFMCAINIKEPITIVGNSMGGMIATILASESSTNFKAGKLNEVIEIDNLVLISPAGAKTDFASQLKPATNNPFHLDNMEDVTTFYKTVMYKPSFIPPALMVYIAQTNYLIKKKQYAHMFRDFFDYDAFFDEPLSTRAKKITLIWGQEDQLLPVSDAEYWCKLLSCESNLLANIGHMPMVECPQQTYSLIH